MAHQYSVAVNNAALDARETAIGASAVLQMRSGAPPANCAAANTGTLLATLLLPADWMVAAASVVKSKAGTWEQLTGTIGGTIGHYRIFNNGQTVCHVQGTVTVTGGGGEMEVNAVVITAGQAVTVTAYSWTSANT